MLDTGSTIARLPLLYTACVNKVIGRVALGRALPRGIVLGDLLPAAPGNIGLGLSSKTSLSRTWQRPPTVGRLSFSDASFRLITLMPTGTDGFMPKNVPVRLLLGTSSFWTKVRKALSEAVLVPLLLCQTNITSWIYTTAVDVGGDTLFAATIIGTGGKPARDHLMFPPPY